VHDETDETIIRITAALRPLPEVDPAQKARVLVAVAAERERARERRIRVARTWRLVGGAAFVAAAGLVAAVWLRTPRPAAELASTTGTVSAPALGGGDSATPGARLTGDAKLAGYKSVQVVLRAPAARHVSVVGDFNGWDTGADAMSRDPVTGLWSHTLALRPGRHVYAFVVDDSVWMRDPRSPEADDEDFGRPGSILLVGQP
jgi:hypothetical protein